VNAGCRIIWIQPFLGHKKRNMTMIYARAHDHIVAEAYFHAMQRVEQRLDIVPGEQKQVGEVVKVQSLLSDWWEHVPVFQLIKRLEPPELCFEERFGLANQLRQIFGAVLEKAP
jgi:hypothetical protein